MNRIISILLSLVIAAAFLPGCHPAAAPENDGKNPRIVTTISPEYDWVRQILGDQADHVELTMLLDNGGGPHGFQPPADDMVTICGCDLFI